MGIESIPMDLLLAVAAMVGAVILLLAFIVPAMTNSGKDANDALNFGCSCDGSDNITVKAQGYSRAVATGHSVFGSVLLYVCNCGDDELDPNDLSISYEVILNGKKFAEGTKSLPEKAKEKTLATNQAATFTWKQAGWDTVTLEGGEYGRGSATVAVYKDGKVENAYSWGFDYLKE